MKRVKRKGPANVLSIRRCNFFKISWLTASDYSHIWDSDSTNLTADNTGIKVPKSFDIEVGFDSKTSTDVVRHCKGSVFSSLNIKSSIGETVTGSMDFLYGIVDTVTTSIGSPIADGVAFPYTFSHASLQFPDGSGNCRGSRLWYFIFI